MPADLVMGLEPGSLDVIFTRTGTWHRVLELLAPDPGQAGALVATPWPAGTVLTVEFASGEVFTATITGALATWFETAATCDAIPAGTPVGWWYVNGTDRECYFEGMVSTRGPAS